MRRRVFSALPFLAAIILPAGPAPAAVLGTPVQVADIAADFMGEPSELTRVGDAILFAGPGDGSGKRIWRLRGGVVTDLAAPCGTEVGSPSSFLQLPGARAIYGTGGCSSGTTELWSLDLATATTVPIVAADAPGSSSVEQFSRVGDRAYFRYNPNELWSTDGTDEGTRLVRSFVSFTGPVVALDGRGVFEAEGGSGYRPWVTDGTEPGTVVLAEVYPALAGNATKLFFALGPRILFLAQTAADGLELWATDGTPGGTERVSDLRPGTEVPDVANIVACAGVAYFSSRGLGPGGTEIGYELWRSDGTIPGTRLVVDLVPGDGSSSARPIGCLGANVLFVGSDAFGAGPLWISDGTAAGTQAIAPDAGLDVQGAALEFDGWLFFAAGVNGEGLELWASNGTAAGTFMTGEIRPGATGSDPLELTALGDSIYFTADDGTTGREIWRVVVDSNLVFLDGFDSGTPAAWAEP